MGVPPLEVIYTSTTTGREDHEVHKGHVVALEKKNYINVTQGFRVSTNILIYESIK
jgi:hypothetical protein